MRTLKVGDHVVYRKQKVSTHPGPRALDVSPCEHGENYWYLVDKFWTVCEVRNDDTIDAVTRTGKRHRIKLTDPRLRRTSILEEVLYHKRFPQLGEVDVPAPETADMMS